MHEGVALPTFAQQIRGVPSPDCKKMLGSIMRSHISLPRPDMAGKCDGRQYRKFVHTLS
jgi:hypothetical protein